MHESKRKAARRAPGSSVYSRQETWPRAADPARSRANESADLAVDRTPQRRSAQRGGTSTQSGLCLQQLQPRLPRRGRGAAGVGEVRLDERVVGGDAARLLQLAHGFARAPEAQE